MLDKEPGPSSGYFSSRNSMTSIRPALVCVLTKIGRESGEENQYTHEDPWSHCPASCSFRGSALHQADYSYSVRFEITHVRWMDTHEFWFWQTQKKKFKKFAESAHNDIFVPPFTLKLVPQNLKRWGRIRSRFGFGISPIFLGITFIVGQGKHMFDLFPSTEKIEGDI